SKKAGFPAKKMKVEAA
nr:Chain A, Prototypical P4[M]cNLS [synthetic construct]